jgi:RNA polymerase sigma-70 factor, ECF subfamily
VKEAGEEFSDHYGRIYRFVRLRSDSDLDAEDLTQTVFLEATAQFARLKSDSRPLLGWLYTVAQRRLVDAARRKRVRGPHVPLDAGVAEPVEAAAYGPVLASAIRGAIATLPPAQREALVMRLILGRSFAEISRTTGATESASKMRVARAVAAVREYLQQEGIEP